MSDIPAMIEDTRTDADDLEADGRDWDANYLRELATALEAEHALVDKYVNEANHWQAENAEAQARIAALEAAAGAYADKPYREELLLELRAVLEKADG